MDQMSSGDYDMACWGQEDKWKNEHHFIGPHKTLYDCEMEMNQMGNDSEKPWTVDSFRETRHGWVVLMCRTMDLNKEEDA